jgi:hypothetical protein
MSSPPIRVLLAGLLALAQLLVPFAHGPAVAVEPWLVAVCTSNGIRLLPAEDAPTAPLHDDDHCALCRITGTMAGAPPGLPSLARLPATGGGHQPAPGPVAQRPPLHDAPARAPPATCSGTDAVTALASIA